MSGAGTTRRRLEEERDALRARLRVMTSTGDVSVNDDGPAPDFLDRAQQRTTAHQHGALTGSLLSRVRSLERALERLDAGNYGACEMCGEEIAQRRLEARPDAALCLSCQERLERQQEVA